MLQVKIYDVENKRIGEIELAQPDQSNKMPNDRASTRRRLARFKRKGLTQR
jgi:hypothetical protein